MTRRVRPRRLRRLDAPEVLSILARGGMLVEAGNVWAVYRARDARRMRTGIVPAALVAELEHGALLRRQEGPPPRLVAAPPPKVS